MLPGTGQGNEVVIVVVVVCPCLGPADLYFVCVAVTTAAAAPCDSEKIESDASESTRNLLSCSCRDACSTSVEPDVRSLTTCETQT